MALMPCYVNNKFIKSRNGSNCQSFPKAQIPIHPSGHLKIYYVFLISMLHAQKMGYLVALLAVGLIDTDLFFAYLHFS